MVGISHDLENLMLHLQDGAAIEQQVFVVVGHK